MVANLTEFADDGARVNFYIFADLGKFTDVGVWGDIATIANTDTFFEDGFWADGDLCLVKFNAGVEVGIRRDAGMKCFLSCGKFPNEQAKRM